MRTDIAILAVTKLGSELCVAGVDRRRNWVRPTSLSSGPWRQFPKLDAYDESNRLVIASSNVVSIRLIRHIPYRGTPHVEDWEYDWKCKPVLVKTLTDPERLYLFERIAEESLVPLLEKQERSLCLIEPSTIVLADFANTSYSGKYQPKLTFAFGGEVYTFKVPDVYWRAVGRHLSANGYNRILRGGKLQAALRYSRIYLAVGLTRMYKGEYWPMIVGVHTVPHFPAETDLESI